MALLIPESVSPSAPPGERTVHAFLKRVFADRSDVVAWHSVRVAGQEIDFALLIPEAGLFAIEVKDWSLPCIIESAADRFLVELTEKPERKTSPYEQARQCAYRIMQVTREEPSLTNSDPRFLGKPAIPVGSIVVFTNISSEEAAASPHAGRLDPRCTIFREDIAPNGRFLSGNSSGAAAFVKFLWDSLPAKFRPPVLDGPRMEALKKQVFSDSVVRTVAPSTAPKPPTRRIGELPLDNLQEQIARAIPDGPRLLKGMAGSGKTLVLIHRAIGKCQDEPVPRVLLTCYNLSLANHIRQTISANLPDAMRGRVTVLPFYDLCGSILEEKVADEGKTEYFDGLTRRALEATATISDNNRYDVLLVDEGQDFNAGMLHVAFSMVRGERNDILVAIDAEQDIYGRASVLDAGIDFSGRIHMLPTAYRCTQQIFDFAHKVSGKPVPPMLDAETGQIVTFPHVAGRTGPTPSLDAFDRIDPLIDQLVYGVQRLMADKVPPAEIAILYGSRTSHAGGADIPSEILAAFKVAQIPVTWVCRDSQGKRGFDLQEPTVKLSTVHSAKGLDFESVFLVDTSGAPLSRLLQGNDIDTVDPRQRNLIFVGATRARERLSVFMLHP